MSSYTGPAHRLTRQQQKALHLFYKLLADELNNSGWNIQKFLKHAVEIDWTKDLIKELLWRPIQKMLTEKGSTTELDKVQEIDLIWEHINRHVGNSAAFTSPFPTIRIRMVKLTYEGKAENMDDHEG